MVCRFAGSEFWIISGMNKELPAKGFLILRPDGFVNPSVNPSADGSADPSADPSTSKKR